MRPQEVHKVPVLRQDDGARLPGREEDLRIFAIAQADILQRYRVYLHLLRKPPGQGRRELGVNPNLHAARIG